MDRSSSKPLDHAGDPVPEVGGPRREREAAIASVVAAIRPLSSRSRRPVLVALDGPSGAGKTTIAAGIAKHLEATIVPGDDFFAAQITDAEWEARSARQRAADAIDWQRLRREALAPLLAGQVARWRAFDFAAGVRPDGTYPMSAEVTERSPAAVIVLDGAYSTRPEFLDLIDLAVLVEAPSRVREARLASREEAMFLSAWHRRWDGAEAHYFQLVRPPSSFDLVVST
jgi:uridine kinase